MYRSVFFRSILLTFYLHLLASNNNIITGYVSYTNVYNIIIYILVGATCLYTPLNRVLLWKWVLKMSIWLRLEQGRCRCPPLKREL